MTTKRRKNTYGYLQPLKMTTSESALSTWWRHYCDAWRKNAMAAARRAGQSLRAGAALLAAKHRGALPLFVDVLRIETGQMRGRWEFSRGRLWVFVG